MVLEETRIREASISLHHSSRDHKFVVCFKQPSLMFLRPFAAWLAAHEYYQGLVAGEDNGIPVFEEVNHENTNHGRIAG